MLIRRARCHRRSDRPWKRRLSQPARSRHQGRASPRLRRLLRERSWAIPAASLARERLDVITLDTFALEEVRPRPGAIRATSERDTSHPSRRRKASRGHPLRARDCRAHRAVSPVDRPRWPVLGQKLRRGSHFEALERRGGRLVAVAVDVRRSLEEHAVSATLDDRIIHSVSPRDPTRVVRARTRAATPRSFLSNSRDIRTPFARTRVRLCQ